MNVKGFRHFRLREAGYSLTEVTIAVGLVGIFALTLLKIADNSTMINNNAQSIVEENSLVTSLFLRLSDKATCSVNLSDKFATGTYTSFVDGDGTQVFPPTGASAPEFIQVNSIKTERVQVSAGPPIIYKDSALKVTLDLQRTRSGFGPSTYQRSFEVVVSFGQVLGTAEAPPSTNIEEIQNPYIVDCFDLQEGIEESAAELTCLANQYVNNAGDISGVYRPPILQGGEFIRCERVPLNLTLNNCNSSEPFYYFMDAPADPSGEYSHSCRGFEGVIPPPTCLGSNFLAYDSGTNALVCRSFVHTDMAGTMDTADVQNCASKPSHGLDLVSNMWRVHCE